MDRAAQGQRELPDGCPTASRHEAASPLLQSPLGAPFGPSVRRGAARPICCPAFRPWGASLALPASNLLYPLLTSADRSGRVPPASVRGYGQPADLPGEDTERLARRRRIYKGHPLRMEDFAVTCPLVPGVPHLLSGSCASPRAYGLGFLQTPPRGDALALLLAFGSAITWREDSHLARSVSCLAHTLRFSGGAERRPLQPVVSRPAGMHPQKIPGSQASGT